jgi:hypothetical protein
MVSLNMQIDMKIILICPICACRHDFAVSDGAIQERTNRIGISQVEMLVMPPKLAVIG